MADVSITQLNDLAPSTNTYVPISNGTVTGKAAYTGSGNPTGSIIMWPLNTPPSGYLICDGSVLSRTTYSALFAVLGTAYGSGDGSTTFSIPDYRGQFLRGWANGQSTDPDRASRTNRGDGTTGDNVGTRQADEFKSHTHSVGPSLNGSGYLGGGATTGTFPPGPPNPLTVITINNTGGNETRPTNVYINYCIKT